VRPRLFGIHGLLIRFGIPQSYYEIAADLGENSIDKGQRKIIIACLAQC
jgi:hypothetical protein